MVMALPGSRSTRHNGVPRAGVGSQKRKISMLAAACCNGVRHSWEAQAQYRLTAGNSPMEVADGVSLPGDGRIDSWR